MIAHWKTDYVLIVNAYLRNSKPERGSNAKLAFYPNLAAVPPDDALACEDVHLKDAAEVALLLLRLGADPLLGHRRATSPLVMPTFCAC